MARRAGLRAETAAVAAHAGKAGHVGDTAARQVRATRHLARVASAAAGAALPLVPAGGVLLLECEEGGVVEAPRTEPGGGACANKGPTRSAFHAPAEKLRVPTYLHLQWPHERATSDKCKTEFSDCVDTRH